MIDANSTQLVDFLENHVGRPDQIGNDLMAEIAAGVGKRHPVRDQPAFHIALFRGLEGLVDSHRELRCDLNIAGVAANLEGTRLESCDALFYFLQGPPARQPALAITRCTL